MNTLCTLQRVYCILRDVDTTIVELLLEMAISFREKWSVTTVDISNKYFDYSLIIACLEAFHALYILTSRFNLGSKDEIMEIRTKSLFLCIIINESSPKVMTIMCKNLR